MKNLENLGELRNKNVVITGSTSGVGRATAEAFALQGANVVIVARGEEAIDETVSLCQDLGVQAFGISTDVSEEKEVKRVVKEAIEKLGSIDIWVNNAGVMASGKFEEIPMDINHQVIKTNLFGYLHGVYYILPYFKEREKGIIINNVSIGGFMPAPYSAVYSATKAGIKKMMECIQGEISDFKDIHICNIYPQIQRSTGNMHSAKFSGLDFKIPPFAADPRDTAAQIVKLAIHPKKDKFPDVMSYFIKTIYGLFPKTMINTSSAAMRILMKIKDAPSEEGNILEPSEYPHRIYGETILPVPSKKTKQAFLIGLGISTALILLKSRKK
jgi:short-subunit dehydrogenase